MGLAMWEFGVHKLRVLRTPPRIPKYPVSHDWMTGPSVEKKQ